MSLLKATEYRVREVELADPGLCFSSWPWGTLEGGGGAGPLAATPGRKL